MTLLLFALLSASACLAQTQVTGAVTYRERVALPADAVIQIQLLDISRANAPSKTVAESMLNAEGRQAPIPFALAYDPAEIAAAHRYSVRATIRSADGMLLFSTTQSYPVLTNGAPSKVTLLLHPVGRGAKPGAAVKPKASAPAQEAAATPVPGPAAQVSTPEVASPPAQPAQEQTPATKIEDQVPPTPVHVETTPSAAGKLPEHEPGEPGKPRGTASEPKEPEPAQTPSKAEATPSQPEPKSSERQVSPAERDISGSAPAPPASPVPAAEPKSPHNNSEPQSAQPVKPVEPEPALPEAPSAVAKLSPPAAETPSAGAEPSPEKGMSSADAEPESRPEPPVVATPLADTQWKLVQLGGQNIVITSPDRPITLAFSPEGRRIAGSAGCNTYIGTFHEDHGSLALNPGNTTLMGCAEPAMSREQKFFATLREADGFRISGNYLALTSKGKVIARFLNELAP